MWLVAALLASGFGAGLLAGLFGIGGGGILVPFLYELFRLAGVREAACMQLAVGTSLAIIIPTAFRSFRSHRKRGAVDMDVVRKLGRRWRLAWWRGSLSRDSPAVRL